MKLSRPGTSGGAVVTTSAKSTAITQDPATSAARAAAGARVKAIENHAKVCPFTGWTDLETRFKVTVPEKIRTQPCSYTTVKQFCAWFTEQAVAEMRVEVTVPLQARVKIPTSEELGEIVVGSKTLRPRQKKALWKIRRALLEAKTARAVMCPMNTGSGKTIIAAALIRELQTNGYYGLGNPFGMWNVVYIVPKSAQIKTVRELKKCGIKDLGTDVQVLAYTDLTARRNQGLFRATTVAHPFKPEETTTHYTFTMGQPVLVIFDECHLLKKRTSGRGLRARGFINPKSHYLFMSATPAITADDLYIYSIAADVKWGGATIDTYSFSQFARAITGDVPTKITTNNDGVANVFKWFDAQFGTVINPPADPRKAKSHNGIKLIKFRDDASRERYKRAEDAWLEMCERMGKFPNERGAILRVFGLYRRAAEAEAAETIAELAYAEIQKGRAPVIACCFKETIKRVVAHLAKLGMTRDQISVIWGGEPDIKESDVYPIQEWTMMGIRDGADRDDYVWSSTQARAKYNRSTKYWTTMMKADRTFTEQKEMDKWLQGMKLYHQDAEQRQDEIDNFQEGRTILCLFTLAAGGTGIDLDQQIAGVRPRTMFAFPCYYAEEFVQAFGRTYREFTLEDVWQYVVMFQGTIMTSSVAPKLSQKLLSLSKSTGTSLNFEAEMLKLASAGKLNRQALIESETQQEFTATTDELLTEEEDEDDEDEK